MEANKLKKRLKELDNRMFTLNRNLSALVYIQKIKTKKEGEAFLQKINREIGEWIKEVRLIHEELEDFCTKDKVEA